MIMALMPSTFVYFVYSHLESMTLLDAILIWIVVLSSLAKMVRIIIKHLFFIFYFFMQTQGGNGTVCMCQTHLITTPY